MRSITALLTMGFFWAIPAHSAQVCSDRVQPVSASAELLLPDFTVSHEKPSAHIRNSEGSKTRKERTPLGLTSVKMVKVVNRLTWKQVTLDQGICLRPSAILAKVGYESRIIRIASEIPRDSCLYKEVLEHEKRHIDISAKALAEYTTNLSDDLAKFVDTFPSALIANGNNDEIRELKERQQQDVMKFVVNYMANFRQIYENSQIMIDDNKEYERLGSVCNGAAKSLRNDLGAKN